MSTQLGIIFPAVVQTYPLRVDRQGQGMGGVLASTLTGQTMPGHVQSARYKRLVQVIISQRWGRTRRQLTTLYKSPWAIKCRVWYSIRFVIQ